MARWYLRCNGCLAVVAIEENPGIKGTTARPADKREEHFACSACGSQFEVMGKVYRDGGHLMQYAGERCPCDDRCTGASGPNCDCSCGGENHGSGRTVPVLRDLGKPPVIQIPQPEVAAARLAEWQAARQAAAVRIGNAYRDVLRPEEQNGKFWAMRWDRDWMPPAAYARYQEGCHVLGLLNKATRYKTHGGRMKAAAKLCPAV